MLPHFHNPIIKWDRLGSENNSFNCLAIKGTEYPINRFIHLPDLVNKYSGEASDRYVELEMETELPKIQFKKHEFIIINYYSKSDGFYIKQAYILSPTIETDGCMTKILFNRWFEETF